MWPRVRRNTVINNNILLAPPRIHHNHFSGFGNVFNWMAGFSLAQNFMSGLFSPFKMQSFMPMTPYYNFTGVPYTSLAHNATGIDAMSAARRTLDSLGFTKESGYSVSMGEDGKLTYTYTRGSQTISAGNLKELLDKQVASKEKSQEPQETQTTQNAQTTETEDDNWFVPAAEHGGEDVAPSEEDAEDAGAAVYSNTTNAEDNGDAYGQSQTYLSNNSSPKGWYRSQNANSDLYQFTESELKEHKGANTSVDFIVNQFVNGYSASNINKDKLRADLIKKNPSVFNADGNLKENSDICKLDIPTSTSVKENYTKKSSKQIKSKQPAVLAQDVNYKMVYKSGNYIYKKNGTGTLDDDAIFVIDDVKYSLKINGQNTKLDYCQITDNRVLHFMDYKLIDPKTGRFNGQKNVGVWGENLKVSYRLEAEPGYTGKLDNAIIKRESDGRVTVTVNNKSYLMDNVMSGAEKVK